MTNIQNIDFIPPVGSGAGRATASQQARAGGNNRADACISDIFLHNSKRNNSISYELDKKREKPICNEKLIIYPNMVEIRLINPPRKFGVAVPKTTKGIIKEFSKKSRREFIKFLCKIPDKLSLWQDVTFSDEVMQVKSARKNVSNDTLNRFRRIVLEKYPSVKIVYKREWQQRISGKLVGEYIPHFHMFISDCTITDDSGFLDLAWELAKIWVDCTRTTEQKALKVAQHSNSYRLINDRDHAIKYATKYVSKPNENWTNESIGRSWGQIGKFNIDEPKVVEMTPAEMAHTKRILRRKIPKKHPLQKAFKQRETSTFLIVKEKTVERVIENVNQQLESNCNDFFKSLAPKSNINSSKKSAGWSK